MELEIQSHRWSSRAPDWQAAAVSGLAAGAVLMVLELFWAATMHDAGPWRIPHMVAAIALGPDLVQSQSFAFSVGVVAVALLTHYVLGLVFGLALGFVIAGFHYEASAGMIQVFGASFGVVLYLFNFHGMSQFFPWFAELRGWSTLIAHLLFGITASLLYWKLARPGADTQRS